MAQNEIISLLNRYRAAEELSAEDLSLLQSIVAKGGAVPEALAQMLDAERGDAAYDAQRWDPVLQQVFKAGKSPIRGKVRPIKRWGWVAAAAAILLLAGGYYKLIQTARQETTSAKSIGPGRNGAVLTLSDGSRIVLDSLPNGVIATQNGAQLSMQNGELRYDGKGETVAYNTMTTPKGRQFQLTLPDGTRVWLNAASSLKYPTAFARERRVEVRGEAYFEIAQDAGRPFRVSLPGNNKDIEVLGTSFNVNAYENEKSIHATLLEGSIRITIDKRQQILQPGQQARITNGIELVKNADIDKVMAWKNGLFNFDGASLEEVMRQLERWYDIDVVYEKGIPDIRFEGELTKDISLGDLLIVLEKSKVHFQIEGRKLTVLP